MHCFKDQCVGNTQHKCSCPAHCFHFSTPCLHPLEKFLHICHYPSFSFLSEGMSFFLALVTHSYPCLYFSRMSTNCQFCLMSLLCKGCSEHSDKPHLYWGWNKATWLQQFLCKNHKLTESSPSSQHGWSQSTVNIHVLSRQVQWYYYLKSLGYCWLHLKSGKLIHESAQINFLAQSSNSSANSKKKGI